MQKLEDIKKAFNMLKLTTPTVPVQPKTKEEALDKKYEFWETQPVPKLDDSAVDVPNEPIQPPLDKAQIPKDSLNLPDGFVWVSLNIDDEHEVGLLYSCISGFLFKFCIFLNR